VYNDVSLSWWTEWRLSRVHDQVIKYEIPNFKFGVRLNAVIFGDTYWAACVQPAFFMTPWVLKVEMEEQLMQCSTTIIDCPSDLKPTSLFGMWPKFLDDCALSPFATFNMFNFPIFQDEPWYLRYVLNTSPLDWDEEHCFPGRIFAADYFKPKIDFEFWGT
jgi:hypothetical protein